MKPSNPERTLLLPLLLCLLAVLPLTGCGVLHAGGDGDDAATAVTVHRGNTFVAGYFETKATFGTKSITGIGRDWFVGRLKDSTWSWVTPSGTSGVDSPLGIDAWTDTDEEGRLLGSSVYVAGHHGGLAHIERFDAGTGMRTAAATFGECTEFSAVAVGQEAVFAACNHALDGWTGVAVYDRDLTFRELFVLDDSSGGRAAAQTRAMRLDSRGLYIFGDFRGFIQVVRVQMLGSDPRLILAALDQDAFLLRLDSGALITGALRAKSGRSIGGEGTVEAADFALGENDIFVGLRPETDLTLDQGRPTPVVCPGAGPAFNFALIRLDGGIVVGASDPLVEDGINALLNVEWAHPWGSCEDGVSLEALDHSAFDLLAAGTFGGIFRTDTDDLASHGGADAFAMYVDSADGREKAAFSGGGEGDEQVFDDAKGGIARSWVVGSYLGETPTFPLVVFDEDILLRGTEETLPPVSRDEVMIWRMPF